MNRNPVIVSTGSFVPETVLTNQDLEQMVETSDEWIQSRTGIRERRIAGDEQAASDLGIEAARRALDETSLEADDLDLIVVATATADMAFPSTACVIQDLLGADECGAFDLSAACSGFIYALSMAYSQVQSGLAEHAMVVATETLSKIIDWEDRTTCVLFGDGASAFVVSNQPDVPEPGVNSLYLKSDGQYKDILQVPIGGSDTPVTPDNVEDSDRYLQMDGPAVYKVAVRKMKQAAVEALERAGLVAEDIDWVIAHQANFRIIEAVQKRLGVPDEKMITNLDRYGNTSAASIGLALDEARRDGRVTSGDRILMVAFGGGLTWASSVVTYP